MDYISLLKEKLLDKGFPPSAAFDIMRLIGTIHVIIPLPDPYLYDTEESTKRYYQSWGDLCNKNAKDYLINVTYMRPVWSNYSLWDMKTKVVNIYKEKYDVYIGRSGKNQDGYFGNPIKLNEGEERKKQLN